MFGIEHFDGCFPHLSVPGSAFTVVGIYHTKLVYWVYLVRLGTACSLLSVLEPRSPGQ